MQMMAKLKAKISDLKTIPINIENSFNFLNFLEFLIPLIFSHIPSVIKRSETDF